MELNATSEHDSSVGQSPTTPAEFWEQRYSGDRQLWSGQPNAAVVSEASRLLPGRALDLACGEGADAIWLASQGWQVTGIDISETAVRRAGDAARDAGVSAQAGFVAADLATWTPGERFDLVTSSFLHSPVELDRRAILRRAAELVRPGGYLLVVSHAAPPPWSEPGHAHRFATPEEEAVALALPEAEWTQIHSEIRPRATLSPSGEPALLEDGVLLLQRKPAAAE